MVWCCSPFCAVAFHDFFKSCSSQISMMGKAAQFVACEIGAACAYVHA